MIDIIFGIIFTIGAIIFIFFRPYTTIENKIIEQNLRRIPKPVFISEYKERLFDKDFKLPSNPEDLSTPATEELK